MSSVGNWTKKGREATLLCWRTCTHIPCAPTPCERLANVRPHPVNVRLANVRPHPANMRTRASLKPDRRVGQLNCDPKSPS
jgi:hypothetical protein